MFKNLLTIFFILAAACDLRAQSPILHIPFDEASVTQSAPDIISGNTFSIPNNFDEPERVPGISGNALRTDGFSTWAAGEFTSNLGSQVTVETWISLESYPSDEEVPHEQLTPSAIISQIQGENGYQIGINTFGQYWFSANINGQKYRCQAPNPFPLYEWVHVAGVIDGSNGAIRLYLNGIEVAAAGIPVNGQLQEANVPLVIGKSNVDKMAWLFRINALNAAIDETKIYDMAKSQSVLNSDYQNGIANAAITGFEAIQVPESRFDHDLQRPAYHAMPPANWTNEPHGLVKYNGQYHIFYQRTPNGPFKYQMHWGHMSSPDFVHWTHQKDALWPTLEWSPTSGYDMKGIWSGDVVVEDGVAHAFYTNVNHSGSFNPGIAHATSSDPNLENWTKQGPVIDRQFVDDFRDPYLWKDGDTWKMIIGASVNGGGGLDYYTSTDLNTWTHQSQFTSVPYGDMDIGSGIWEMPVFESLENGKHLLIANPIGGVTAKYGPTYTRGVYWIGTWDGNQFTPDYNQPKMLDVIHGHLSPSVTRRDDGKLVGVGIVDERWSSQAQLDAGWCHTFSLPRVYSLMSDNQTLGQAPAPETQSLRVSGSQMSVADISVSGTQPIEASGRSAEIIVTVDPATAGTKYGLNFFVSDDRSEITRLYYDTETKQIILDKSQSSHSPHTEEDVILRGAYDEAVFGKPQKFHVFLDNSVIDVFINDAAAFSNRIYPTLAISDKIELFSEGTTNFTSVEVWALNTDATPVAVSGVSLNKTSTVVPLTTTETLHPTVMPLSATNRSISWSSSNPVVATVSSSGVVTPVSIGMATITVTTEDGGHTANCQVEVTAAPNFLIYDFESGDLSNWIVEGDAFTNEDVTADTDWGWGGPFNQQGTYHFWGAKNGGDGRTGAMRTQDFVLGGSGKITFMIGGGFDIHSLYIALVRKSDGVELMRATGDNNDSEAYTQKHFDASAHVGTLCYIKVVDNHTGGWGHINLDNLKIPHQEGIAVEGVAVSPVTVNLPEGGRAILSATVAPENASNKVVSWSSSNPEVATVNHEGVVAAVAAGTATITATTEEGGFTAETSVTVTPQEFLVYNFESGDLSGWTVKGDAFTNEDVTSATDWGWGGPFNQQGTYHFWGAKNGGDGRTGAMRTQDFVLGGSGKITFMIGGGFDSHSLYIALVRKSDGVELMRATGDNNDSEGYTQKHFDASAHVGTLCYIKVVDNHTGGWGHINLDDLEIPYGEGIPVEGISINPTAVTLPVGDNFALAASVYPENASNHTVSWSSNNPEVATVDGEGRVTTLAYGTAIITATTEEGSFSAQSTVTVFPQEFLVYDFESGDLSNWIVEGDAFTNEDVATDTDWGWGGPFNQQGTYHYWGAKNGGDGRTGSMRTKDFILGGSGNISFMVGGGFDLHTVYIALVRKSDGLELMRATGDNNDSEAYVQKQFSASAYVGTECYIKVVDTATGGWGHINLDYLIIPVGHEPATNPSGTESQNGFTQAAPNTPDRGISLYPNPSNEKVFYLSTEMENVEGDFEMSILTLNGREVKSAGVEIQNGHLIKVYHNLPAGVYFVRLRQGSMVHTKKLLVQE